MKWFNLSSIDWLMVIPLAILLIFSLATLFSIDQSYFKSQLIFLIFCIFVFIVFSQFNLSVLRYYSLPIYIISLILLLVVLVVGIESRGSTRWLDFFGFRIQFSEILKPFLAISFASYLSQLKDHSLKSFFISLALLLPVVLLIFLQPDLGNALIYVFVVLLTLLVYGFPFRWFFAGFAAWLATLPFFWLILHDYQRQRILTFIDPSKDPLGHSYNAIQAIIAVGSGMILGKGFGQGTQSGLRFLPESHTDFIFATISEEAGFIGALILIFAFCFLLYRIYLRVRDSDDKFAKIFSSIVFLIIFVHFFINVGMNLGIVPIVGVTLPFVSYGGSSLLSNFILLGLLFAVHKTNKRQVLEIG